ncbi:MAG: class I SAM-dependent methyltransferase [Planctomycetota bacterium]|nr:MAG: class I SAM-dependent methyltransferase [Planctomycetota bacterium]
MSQSKPDTLPEYATLMAAYHEAHRAEFETMIRDLPYSATSRVLDVPCGDGFYSALLADRMEPDGEVIALDVSRAFLDEVEAQPRANPKGAPIRTLEGDAMRLPFDDGSFDFVWCAQSLISLAKPWQAASSDAVAALAEARRVLRDGATLGVLEHDELHHLLLPWPTKLELALQQALRADFRRTKGAPEQLEVGRHLRSMCARAGFSKVDRVTYVTDRQWPLSDGERRFLEMYLAQLRNRVEGHLEASRAGEFDRLTTPGSSDFLLDQPEFEMACLDVVCLARKS